MFKGKVISVVVPAYNEEDLIASVIRTMPSFVDHVVVVDDCSDDATSEEAAAAGDPRVTVIRHEKNTGVGGAVVTGHRRALELGTDIDVVMAGDGQMDPNYLAQLVEPIADRGYGFTKANRFFSWASFEGMPRHRILGNVILSFLTKLSSGYWHLFDPQNGYTAISRQALERLPLDRIASGYQFENDLLIFLNILRVPALDVPVPARYGQEVSGIRLRRVVPAISFLLLRGFWRRVLMKYVLWSFSPIGLFLLSGIGLLLFSFAFGAWVVVQTIGPPVATTGTVLLAVVPFIAGVQLLLFALMLDILESPDKPVPTLLGPGDAAADAGPR